MAHILKSLLNRLSAFLANILNLKLNVEIKELETELRCRRRSYWLLIHALPWECRFPATSEALKELFICCRIKSGRFSRVAPVSWDLPPPFFANRVDSLFFHLKTREFKFLTFLGEGWWGGARKKNPKLSITFCLRDRGQAGIWDPTPSSEKGCSVILSMDVTF